MAYIGKRMSERAFNAYQEGAKPLSKWTKEEIMDHIRSLDPSKAEKLLKAKKQVLASGLRQN